MLAIIVSIGASLFFGVLAIVFSIREERLKKLLSEKEQDHKHRIYEIAILKEIQERIGYSLDTEKVIDVITGSLRNLFPYSSASSILIQEEKLVFKMYLEESVSHTFVSQVKTSMMASLSALVPGQLPSIVDENITGVVLDDSNLATLSSFFHIPLVVRDRVVGLINVSSTKPNLYKEDEMTILYQITNQASSALSKLETVLTTEKGKLMAIIGSLADGLFMLDPKQELTMINQTAKKFLMLTKDHPTIVDVLSAFPHTFDLGSKINEAMEKNTTIEEKEIQLANTSAQVFITPVLKPDIKPPYNKSSFIGTAVLLHDITLEKNLARMKEDFTNIIVHELRAPLSAIKAATELIQSQKQKLSEEEQHKMLDLIKRESLRLLDEVSTLLDAAKLEGGRFTIQKAESDLKKIIEEKIEIFLPQAMGKHVTLTPRLDQSIVPFGFDSHYISQVVNNLLSNSLKFTPEGGHIEVTAVRNDNTVKVSVSDNGMGIPKDKQPTLFSKFTQVQNQHSKIGTGLGLYIVKGVIEAHGGSVSLESDIGKGTTISFTLPYEHKEKETAPFVDPKFLPN